MQAQPGLSTCRWSCESGCRAAAASGLQAAPALPAKHGWVVGEAGSRAGVEGSTLTLALGTGRSGLTRLGISLCLEESSNALQAVS